MKKLILTVAAGMYAAIAFANHLVGGDFFYSCTGGNNYHVTLKIFRDCNSQTQYDANAYVYAFDQAGNLITTLGMPLQPSVPVDPPDYPCLEPTGVCVESATYEGDMTLPPIVGGYTLVFQRCCRNVTISNLIIQQGGPSGATPPGSTYTIHIPGSETGITCNNSAHFNSFPPTFVCLNAGISFDHSATDADGDSLAYQLVNPLDGADGCCPVVSPTVTGGGPGCSTTCPTSPPPPPYNSVPWETGYSATNPLNNPSNADNLRIDPVTGLLSGIPNQTGQYVVGVAVKEYRNGVLISTTVRDFQFNVVPCDIPQVNITPLPGTVNTYILNCNDRTVSFSNNITYYNPTPTNIPLNYAWDFGVPGITTDTSSQRNPTYTYPDTGIYRVKIVVFKQKNGEFCYDSTFALVKIYPGLTAMLGVQEHCQDSAITFADLSASPYGVKTNWTWNFGDGAAAYTANPSHIYGSAGNFPVSLTVFNDKGCYGIARDTIRVRAQPVANFIATPLCLTDTSSFQNTSTGNITNYYWDFGNSQQSTLANPSVVYTTPGTKTVTLMVVTDEGCRDTVRQQLVVHPLPAVTTSPDKKICPFTSTTLSASGGISYLWNNGGTLSDSTIANPVASPKQNPTLYVVKVTDANGCSKRDTVVISLYPIPQIDAGVDTSVCLNPGSFRDSVQLHATGGVSYTWTPPTGLTATNIPNPTSRPAVNTTYFVTGTDTNNCKLTDSVTVYVLDPALNLIAEDFKAICRFDTTTLTVLKQGYSFYSWSPPLGISNPFANSPRFFPHDTSQYIFYVENYCYQKRDTVTILVHPLPPLTTEHIDSVCIGDSVQIHASGAVFYHWNYNVTLSDSTIPNPVVFPADTTMYYVKGTDTFGCVNRDSVLVWVHQLPNPLVLPDTAFICQGQPVELRAFGGVDYAWQPDLSLSSLTISNPIATPLDTTTYYVRVFNIHQCHADDSITINVQLPVVADAQSPYDVCVGNTVHLHATGGFYYHWEPAGALSNPNVADPFATPSSSVNYIVKVSNDCFSDTAVAEIIIRPLPITDAGLDTTIWRNTEAILHASTDADSFYWWPGELVLEPLKANAPTRPLQTSTYWLFTVSQYGCRNKDSVTVFVEPHTIVMLPTAFSPNGDGENDVFRIVQYLNIASLQAFDVYNRWGQKTFSTNDINAGWDGKRNGEPADIGVYTWIITATTYDGDKVLKKGNVTLLR
ncbi:MAG: PKD domain-containing protein [Chitinophagales bacterium]